MRFHTQQLFNIPWGEPLIHINMGQQLIKASPKLLQLLFFSQNLNLSPSGNQFYFGKSLLDQLKILVLSTPQHRREIIFERNSLFAQYSLLLWTICRG